MATTGDRHLTIYEAQEEPVADQPGFIPSRRSFRTRIEHWIAGTQH